MKRVILLLWVLCLSLTGKAWIPNSTQTDAFGTFTPAAARLTKSSPSMIPMHSTSRMLAVDDDDDPWGDPSGWKDPDWDDPVDDDDPWDDPDDPWDDPYYTKEDAPIGDIWPLLLMMMAYVITKSAKYGYRKYCQRQEKR